MAPITTAELADSAGVPSSFVDSLCHAGILTGDGSDRPFTAGDVRRTQLVHACARAGMSVEAIGEAIRRGTLTLEALDRDYYERWETRAETTYADLAEQTGVSWEFFRSISVALGFPPVEPGDRPRQDEVMLLPAFAVALRFGFDEDALLRLLRVYGESIRRITRAETQMWHDFIDVPAQRAGANQAQILAGGAEFGAEVLAVIDQSVLAVYHRMQETAWMEDLVEHIELGLEEAGVHTRLERPPAMCFVDLAGYTRLTEERGDEAAADLATAFGDVVQATATSHGGHAVKWLGDGVMLSFRRPADAVLAALELVDATPENGLPPAHVGVHAGPVVVRDGDYFGRTVNLASRLSGRAGPHEVLVTREVVEECRDAPVTFSSIGPIELKGLAHPVEAFQAARHAAG